jgi:hypothetical protein
MASSKTFKEKRSTVFRGIRGGAAIVIASFSAVACRNPPLTARTTQTNKNESLVLALKSLIGSTLCLGLYICIIARNRFIAPEDRNGMGLVRRGSDGVNILQSTLQRRFVTVTASILLVAGRFFWRVCSQRAPTATKATATTTSTRRL